MNKINITIYIYIYLFIYVPLSLLENCAGISSPKFHCLTMLLSRQSSAVLTAC